MFVIPDSLIRRSDAILVLTSGLKREVAAGKGLDPMACAPSVCSASASGVPSARVSGRLSEQAPSLVCVFVCRLAASQGGCNTLDPRFIFRRVCMCVCVSVCRRRGNQNSKERRAREKEEEDREEEESSVAKIR